ncbi:hypothetical protein ACOSQ3_014586 [Xanthoceras sorbifolium]
MDQNEITRRCGKLSLSEENGPIAKIDSDLHEKGLKCVVRSLIGIIMENKEVNREAFKSMIPKIWRTMKEVDEIDSRPNGDCLGKFLRVRVMVGTLAPLKRGLRIALGGCGDVDSILLCYERLPNFCYCCG